MRLMIVIGIVDGFFLPKEISVHIFKLMGREFVHSFSGQ